MGNIVGLSALGFAGLLYIVPLAIIDIIVSGSNVSPVFKALYMLFIVPAIFYFFYFSVLFVKRMHDIGFPGLLILGFIIILELIARIVDIQILNIAGFVILLGVSALPGQKNRNSFGQRPQKKFKTADIVVRF